MGGEGVEPSPPCGEGILSPSCLPFHHPPINSQRNGGGTGIRTLDNGFAIRCLSPLGHAASNQLYSGVSINAIGMITRMVDLKGKLIRNVIEFSDTLQTSQRLYKKRF